MVEHPDPLQWVGCVGATLEQVAEAERGPRSSRSSLRSDFVFKNLTNFSVMRADRYMTRSSSGAKAVAVNFVNPDFVTDNSLGGVQ